MKNKQRGWAGLVVLLIAVLIVAFLAKDALLKYLGPVATTQKAGPGTNLDPAASDASAPTPANAMEKAKALEGLMQQESTKRDGGN